MKSNTIAHFALAAAFAALALAACDRNAQDRAASGNATVGQRLDGAIDKTQQALDKAGQKTGEKLGEAGEKLATAASDVKEGVQNAQAGLALADTAITASIKTDYLKDPDLSVLKIDVETKDGVVTLNGLAGNEMAISRAARLASAVKGVREVRNFLTVKQA